MNVRKLLRNCISWTDLRDRLVDWIMQDPWMRRSPLSRERVVGSVIPGPSVTWYKKDGAVASSADLDEALRPRTEKDTCWAGSLVSPVMKNHMDQLCDPSCSLENIAKRAGVWVDPRDVLKEVPMKYDPEAAQKRSTDSLLGEWTFDDKNKEIGTEIAWERARMRSVGPYEVFRASNAYNAELDKYAPVKPGSPMRLSWLHDRPYKLYDREMPKVSGPGDNSSD